MDKQAQLSSKTFDQALQSDPVRRALAARAARMLPKAQLEAAKAGRLQLAKALKVQSGVRPGTKAKGGMKRPFYRIYADYPEELSKLDSRARLTSREVLRRASRG